MSNITFKKFKYHAGLSQETVAYTADVYLDGKHIGWADNDGRGGSDTFCAKDNNFWKTDLAKTIEDDTMALACKMADEQELKKEFSRIKRKWSFWSGAYTGDFECIAKKTRSGRPVTLEQAKAHVAKMYPDREIKWLNDITFEEFKAYDEALFGGYEQAEDVLAGL